MMDGSAELTVFDYGEDREQVSGRSLGYRRLSPATPSAWADEAESLARKLQAAPYPDAWPAVDLFCSVLLADGRRLVARVRYGLSDHTPSQRRGGLELAGVVGPAALTAEQARGIYRWLGQRLAGEEDRHALGGTIRLADVLAAAPPEPPRPDGLTSPVPVLPVRLWQDGAFLFAAAAPADPDLHLRLLDSAATANWQWLPLVGPDFPLPTFAQRGPLVAWTAHLAGVAVRLDRPASSAALPRRSPRSRVVWWVAAMMGFLIVVLLAGNLWQMHVLREAITHAQAAAPAVKEEPRKLVGPTPRDGDRDRFARALYDVLRERGERPSKEERDALLERYEGLVRRHPDLAVAADNEQGKLAVGAAAVLAGRNPARIEQLVRQALENKGFSDRLIQAAREHVREQLAAEAAGR
jgi:hypothetical protein